MARPETRGEENQALEKLPIGVDDQGQIVASTVTESHEQDPSQVPALLSQVDQLLNGFVGDGMYDQEPVYAAVEAHSPGARVIIPPRKDAVLSPTASTAPAQRDQHLLEIERTGRFAWKRMSGYYAQSHAENAFARLCVQRRRTRSAGASPAKVKARSLVAWMAGRRETEFLKPIDNAIFGMAASHRAVAQANTEVAPKVRNPGGRTCNRRVKAA
jgi:hypothetical protein